MRLLYRSRHRPRLGTHGNRGLWFDKFCDTWRQENGAWTMRTARSERRGDKVINPKSDWLRTVLKPSPIVGDAEQIHIAADRLVRLVTNTGGRFCVFQTESRFVTGLGRTHPVENGFAWHPTLGTPFLPGSSVKGLVRAWAKAEADAGRFESEVLTRIFGESGSSGHAGSVCFLEAVPVKPVHLELDVLTPHAGGWDKDNPPGDWRSPVPVPFLVTAAEQPFLFCVVPSRSRTAESTASDLDRVAGWLEDALAWEGAGAKTAVGYGRFAKDRKRSVKLRAPFEAKARAQAMESTEGRWRVLVGEWSEAQLLEQIRTKLEANKLTDPSERLAFVAAIREIRGTWLAKWRKKSKSDTDTNLGGKKLKARAKLIDSEPLE